MRTTWRSEGSRSVQSHFLLLVLFSTFVSLVFAVLTGDTPREQFRLWAAIFGGFIGTGVVLGWLLYPFPL